MSDGDLSIGEVARATGLTVRALRHYDELGLVVPARRPGGHRRYGPGAVRRLYAVRALRSLGLSLAEIAASLDGDDPDLAGAMRRHLAHVERQVDVHVRLRDRLRGLLSALDRGRPATQDELLKAIEEMTMTEQYYTDEQLEQLRARREALGPQGMEQAQRDWAELIAAVEAERERGTDPADPRVQALMERWQALIDAFTGGDAGIRASLDRMYAEQGAERASRGGMSPELGAYVGRAMSARRS